MNWNVKSLAAHGLILTALLAIATIARAQSVTLPQPPSSVIVLDSTRAQDGLNGSVRRVKTESAKLELKKGQIVEGPRQLVEITTYDVSGKRIENVSYPVSSSSVGKEEYKYDDRGNLIEMTMRGDGGVILSKETYNYEFDRFGNWTKMVTSLVVFESEELKREPVEVTYRSLTYYFNDNVAKITDSPSNGTMPTIPPPSGPQISLPAVESQSYQLASGDLPPSVPVSVGDLSLSVRVNVGDPPPDNKPPMVENDNSAVSVDSESNEPASGTSTEAVATSRIPVASEPAPSASSDSGETGRAESNPMKVASTDATANKQAFELYKTARDLFDSGDAKGAVGAYLQSIELAPKSADVQLGLGQAYLKLKKDKEASKAFKESLRLNPSLAEAQYGLGLAAFRMGRHKDAADAFKRAIQISPDLAKAHYGLALAYQELQDAKGVINEYRILQTLNRELAKQLQRAFPAFDLPCRGGANCK
jgi:Flp pilus assembly protein TadD